MSKFNSYAKKVDEIAKAAFEEYRKAEKALKNAQAALDNTPEYHVGMSRELNSYGYQAKRAQAQADLYKAQADFRHAKEVFVKHTDEIKALRKELEAEIDEHYAADPAALDSNTLELLKSGVLKTNEYKKLMDKAQAEENYTMARVIAKYAGDAAADVEQKYGKNSENARQMRAISYTVINNNGNDILQAFDVMADVYNRATNNPGMIDHWDELTGEIVENM